MAREDTRSFAGEGMPFSMAYMVIQDNQSADFQFLGASLSQGDGATSRRVRLHRHAHYEVVFVLEGEFVQHLENGEFRYRAAMCDTCDPCLRELYDELAADCARHAAAVRSLLESAL